MNRPVLFSLPASLETYQALGNFILQFEGRSVSPAELVNEVAKCARNAWRTLWIRFPDESEWKHALSLRKKSEEIKTIKDRTRPKKTG